MTMETMLAQLRLESDVARAVKEKFTKDRGQILEIAETAYCSDDFDFPLCKRMPLTRLTVVTYLLTTKYAEYEAVGVPEDVIGDTFRECITAGESVFQTERQSGSEQRRRALVPTHNERMYFSDWRVAVPEIRDAVSG